MSWSEDPIEVRGVVIPAAELQWRFDTSGGPGGQHANRSSTRVHLTWDIAASPSLDDRRRARLLRRLGAEAGDGSVTVSAADSRSQWRNRAIARERLAALLDRALRPRPPRRRATQPSASAHRRRLDAKRHRSRVKRLRKRPEPE